MNTDHQLADARILGQLLAAQNILFVLPTGRKIAEFYVKALSTIPGITFCYVCLENIFAQEGECPGNYYSLFREMCKKGLKSLTQETIGQLNNNKDLRVMNIESLDAIFGYFIIGVDNSGLFEIYEPFIKNLSNFIALFLENLQQKKDLQKGQSRLEQMVKKRTAELISVTEDLKLEVHERKLAEKTLREQYSTLSGIINSANAIIFSVDRNLFYTSFNKIHADLMKAIYGVQIETGHSILDYMTVNEDREKARINLERALTGEQLIEEDFSGDVQLTRKYFSVSHSPIRNETGGVIGVAVLSYDITERKVAEEALRKSEAGLKEAQHLGKLGSWDWDAVTDKITWSEEYYRIYGIDPAQRPPGYEEHLKVYTPQSAALLDAAVKRNLETGEPYEIDLELADPKTPCRWITARSETKRDANGKITGLRGTAQDITTRKESEQKIFESQRMFRTLVENSPDIIARYDRSCRRIYVNPVYLRESKIPQQELIASTPLERSPLSPESALVLQNLLRQVLDSGLADSADVLWTKTDGRDYWYNVYASPEFDKDGKIESVMAISRDITARKHAEEEIHNLNQELEKRVASRTAQLEEANQELEDFAYTVSHDLRAPLRHIDGFLELLKKKIEKKLDEKDRHYISMVFNATKKMGGLIEDLLSFSRMKRGAFSRQKVNFNQLIHEVIRDYEPDIKERKVIWQIRELPEITGDKAMLRIVLVNLLSNALKFTRTCQESVIEVSCRKESEGNNIFSVRDNGVGFDPAYGDKLFGVFQRLHRMDEFEGNGIGLAIVRRIVMRHGGKVWAEGKPNEGAVFYFSLPDQG